MVEEVRRDPVTGEAVVVKRGGGNSTLLIVLLLAAALAALAYFTGLLNFSGKVEAPKVSVQGGELPDASVGKVVVGTKKETIDVPVVGVQKAEGAEDRNN